MTEGVDQALMYANGSVVLEWVDGSDAESESDSDDEDNEEEEEETRQTEETDESPTPQHTSIQSDSAVGHQQSETETPQQQAHQAQEESTQINDTSNFPVSSKGFAIAPRYYCWKDHYPCLSPLVSQYNAIKDELLQLTQGRWCPWPEYKLYQSTDQNGDWKVIPLIHTFPAWDPSRTKYVENNCKACPVTMSILKSIPGIRTALFSRLGPRTRLSSHQGWADLSNYVLRVHLPLVMPDKSKFPKSCGMWVEGEVAFHEEGELLVFDDSKFHKAFNASDEERLILIVDVERPRDVPLGLATGGHTEQLDAFISEYENNLSLWT